MLSYISYGIKNKKKIRLHFARVSNLYTTNETSTVPDDALFVQTYIIMNARMYLYNAYMFGRRYPTVFGINVSHVCMLGIFIIIIIMNIFIYSCLLYCMYVPCV